MKRTIVVTPPKNLSSKDRHIFLSSLCYTIDDLVVRQLKRAFITFSGFTIDSNGLVKESHHNYDFQYQSYLAEALSYYREATLNPGQLIELKDDKSKYLQIFHPWFNYGHWLFDSILRLWLVKDRAEGMVLLLPEFYGRTRFIQESLEPFKFREIFYIPAQKSVLVSNLCLPQVKPIVDSYHKRELIEIRNFYLEYARKKKLKNIPVLEKIYLSRKNSIRRFILNEAEVEATLEKHGFTTINADDFGFFEQVAIYSEARFLVSIMGAGLSNMLFMKAESSILEFHKSLNPGDVHCKTFWYLADALSFDYFYQFCLSPNSTADVYTADLVVNMTLLEENVTKMLNSRF